MTTDDAAGGKLTGEHLIERGHRRLAFVGGSTISAQVERRFVGFSEEVEGKAESLRRIETTSWRFEDGLRAAGAIAELPADERPTGVMCANDLIALGVLQGLWQRGIRVPDDVALVGFDDLEWAAASMVPLSSVHQKRHELGQIAVQMLVDEITNGDEHVHRHVVLPTRTHRARLQRPGGNPLGARAGAPQARRPEGNHDNTVESDRRRR